MVKYFSFWPCVAIFTILVFNTASALPNQSEFGHNSSEQSLSFNKVPTAVSDPENSIENETEDHTSALEPDDATTLEPDDATTLEPDDATPKASDDSIAAMSEPRSVGRLSYGMTFVWGALIFSLIANILIGLALMQQMRWRKHIVQNEKVLMPEQWVNRLSENLSVVHRSLIDLNELSRSNYKRLSDLLDISETLHTVINEKDEQIRRFRKGYDEHIYIQFLSKFTNITEAVLRLSKKEAISSDDIENIHFRLSDALEDCNVSVKDIEVGSVYADLGSMVEDNPKTLSTNDASLALTVAEVLRPAYVVSSAEGDQVVLPAKVVIYTN